MLYSVGEGHQHDLLPLIHRWSGARLVSDTMLILIYFYFFTFGSMDSRCWVGEGHQHVLLPLILQLSSPRLMREGCQFFRLAWC